MCEKCDKDYACMCLRMQVNIDLKRTNLYELGRKTPYYKHLDIPDLTEKIFGPEISYSFPIDEEDYTESVIYSGSPNVWKTPKEKLCDCDIVLLMQSGCKCGGK